ncbi:hypothetical protein NU08_3848 [Flavobacterium anhuiense]|uniref:Uncharacterized protein n=1 Tax=Flavobacterium anhuiense TaxID=459526 RepID=A0A444VUM3_9FLAO|nr:hypothetical protein NU08_3848 [Flavobacterium anhuiense]
MVLIQKTSKQFSKNSSFFKTPKTIYLIYNVFSLKYNYYNVRV